MTTYEKYEDLLLNDIVFDTDDDKKIIGDVIFDTPIDKNYTFTKAQIEIIDKYFMPPVYNFPTSGLNVKKSRSKKSQKKKSQKSRSKNIKPKKIKIKKY